MLQNISTNFSRHQRSTEEFTNTTATIPNIICDGKEDNLRDTINSNPTVNTDVDDIFSSYHDKYIATNLTHNTSDVIDISSGDIVTTDNSLAPNSQKELTQQICNAADMACKAKRVNQLMSYVSGVDYSEKQDSTYEQADSGPKNSNNNEHSLISEDPLIFSKDQQFVFAVNSNNISVSSFRINDDYSLTPMSLGVPTKNESAWQKPVSLTLIEDILYVVNTSNSEIRDQHKTASKSFVLNCYYYSAVSSCVTGFRVSEDGSLNVLTDSELAALMC